MIDPAQVTNRIIPPHKRNARGLFLAGCLRRGCALAAVSLAAAPQLSAKLREPASPSATASQITPTPANPPQ